MIIKCDDMMVCFLCTLAFLIGAIPTGYLLAQLYGISDIRVFGSGNIGASNVGRLLGWKAFVLVFFLDALKAAGTLWFAQKFSASHETLLIVAFATLLGNCYSPFLGFNGGKGVATLMGIVGAFSPLLMCCAISIWLSIFSLTHIPARASISTLCVLPFLSYFFMSFSFIFFLVGTFLVVLWRHERNFQFINYVKK
ncbi:MAG TPA: glycerol-3-phosphate acyltransferase [Patescibacteria group bacterium]|nr:glycerol-3-phosphate acyltransferase [Patescibacteria group bacterium]